SVGTRGRGASPGLVWRAARPRLPGRLCRGAGDRPRPWAGAVAGPGPGTPPRGARRSVAWGPAGLRQAPAEVSARARGRDRSEVEGEGRLAVLTASLPHGSVSPTRNGREGECNGSEWHE